VSPQPSSDGPRWLSPEEQCHWRSFLVATSALFDTLDRQMQADSGFPHAYYEVLVHLSEAPDRRLRMSELADRTVSSRSRASHAVARLEERGLVRREPCASDGRGQLAVLTEEGMAVLEQAAPAHVEAVRRHLLDRLGPEDFATLGRISAKLRGESAC
jgi:DNA-binding MarR family transcriptional regulator